MSGSAVMTESASSSLLGELGEPPHSGSWLSRFRRSSASVLLVVAMAIFVDLLVYCIIIPVLPLFVRDHLDGSSSAIGVLFACYAGGLLLATPLSAWWSDRAASRRLPMLVGLGAMFASTILFAFADSMWLLALARTAQGMSAAVSNTIGLSMLADVYPSSKLPEAMGVAMAVQGLGGLAGPPIGGALYDHVSFRSVFYVAASLAALDFLFRIVFIDDAWMLRQRARIQAQAAMERAANAGAPRAPALTEASSTGDSTVAAAAATATEPSVSRLTHVSVDTASGYGALSDFVPEPDVAAPATGAVAAAAADETITLWGLMQQRNLQVTLVGVISLSTVFTGLEPLLALHFDDAFDSESSEIGLSYFAIAIPYSLAAVLVTPLQEAGYNPKLLVAAGFALLVPGLMCMTLARSLLVSLAPMCGIGIALGITITPPLGEIGAWLTKTGNQGAFAQGFAVFNLAYSVGMFLGPVIAGAVYDYASYWLTMTTFAAMCAATALLLLVVGMKERAEEKQERRIQLAATEDGEGNTAGQPSDAGLLGSDAVASDMP